MIVHCPHDGLVSLKELKSHPKNRNKHPADQVKRLAKILEYQGWRYPVKVSKRSGFVTSGHGRIEAAHANGWKEVPVSFQDYDSDEQEYADVQADNAIASWSDLDLSAINMDLPEMGPDFDLDMLGIKDFVLEPADKLEPGCDEDEVPEAVEPTCKLGDVWTLGRHRLMCGDSTSIDAVDTLMSGEKADMVFTDPPYNIGFGGTMSSTTKGGVLMPFKTENTKYDEIKNDRKTSEDFRQFMADALAVVRTYCMGAWYISFSSSTIDELLNPLKRSDMKWKSIIIWVKNQAPMGGGDYKRKYEPIVYGNFSGDFYGEAYCEDDVWEFQRTLKNDLHPTMKPIPLIENAIQHGSKMGHAVLDLFGGSGSTLIACEKTNRRCFMMELDPHYCDVIIARWEKYTGQKAVLDGE